MQPNRFDFGRKQEEKIPLNPTIRNCNYFSFEYYKSFEYVSQVPLFLSQPVAYTRTRFCSWEAPDRYPLTILYPISLLVHWQGSMCETKAKQSEFEVCVCIKIALKIDFHLG